MSNICHLTLVKINIVNLYQEEDQAGMKKLMVGMGR